MKRIKEKYNKWLYRFICLYDYYWIGGYTPPQKELHEYSGYWDWLGKNTRSSIVYKVSKLYIKS